MTGLTGLTPLGRHGQEPAVARPRYRRITAASSALLVTLVAVLGGIGILPTSPAQEAVFAKPPAAAAQGQTGPVSSLRLSAWASASMPRYQDVRHQAQVGSTSLPARSGQGRRVVFDMSDQRVWLVSATDHVQRTYLVSGSLTENLGAGSYEVYSTSMNATGIEDSGTMKYMVRFTQGANAAIGFHDIPIHHGHTVQTAEQLGTPQSHGCIRQLRRDAKALWDFAPVGTKVVVLA